MSEYQYTHYDVDHEGRGKTMLVLDSFRLMAEAIDNDVIPASRSDNVVPGINQPASTLSSANGNQNYTVLPLTPADKDVNFLPENFVHQMLELDIEATVDNAPATDQDFAIYFPSAWSIPSRYGSGIGGSNITTNQFQREESMVTMASLPQEIIQHNNEYVTMSKIAKREAIPGGYVTWKKNQTSQNFSVYVDTTADLSHMTPLISNIPFVVHKMGDLNIKLWYENLDTALNITPIPSSLYNGEGLSCPNFHVLEQLPFNKPIKFKTDTVQGLATGENTIAAKVDGKVSTFKFVLKGWKMVNTGVELIQCNFSVKQESLDAMEQFIAEDNQLVIPTQNWNTQLSNNPVPISKSGMTAQVVWNIALYNVHLLAFLFPYTITSSTYFPHPKFTNIEVKLNSKSITYGNYSYVDARAVKDTLQALVNVDRYGANENLVNSLVMNPFSNGYYNKEIYASVYSSSGGPIIHRPNSFVLAKGLNPPNSFEKGYCVDSKTSTTSQIILSFTSGENLDEGIDQLNPGMYTGDVQPFCLALQDCCLVLKYNPRSRACESGTISYVTPSVA